MTLDLDEIFGTPANDFYEMELIGDHMMLVAVPLAAPPLLKKRILGAIKSYHLAGRSVDYVIKRYGENWKFPEASAKDLELRHVLRDVDRLVTDLIRELSSGKPRPDCVGLFAAEAALVRLRPTFRSALFLISQGHAFEAATMVRLALEQVSWAYAVHKIDDEATVFRISATSAVSGLKKIVPYVGRLYGELSKRTHLDSESTRGYIHLGGDGVVAIRFAMSEESRIVLAYVILVLSLYQATILNISGQYMRSVSDKSTFDDEETTPKRLARMFAAIQTEHPRLAWLPHNPWQAAPEQIEE